MQGHLKHLCGYFDLKWVDNYTSPKGPDLCFVFKIVKLALDFAELKSLAADGGISLWTKQRSSEGG
jgi:hypothetical protein